MASTRVSPAKGRVRGSAPAQPVVAVAPQKPVNSGPWSRASRVLVLLVVFVVGITTLHDLNGTPPGLYIDEVAIALTARALWETGADLYGDRVPLFPVSFRDRESRMLVNPVYTYTAIPFAVAGPGGWSARLPSVLWCWIAAAGIGLCVHETTRSRWIAFGVGAAAALTPWLFVMGRMGWEAISFPAATSLAVWSLLRGARTGASRPFLWSGLLFGLSLYAYSTARLLVPLTVGAAALILVADARVRWSLTRMLLIVALMGVPMAFHMLLHPGALTWRMGDMSIWRDSPGLPDLVQRFATNDLRYFSPQFLFLEGDSNLRHGMGRGMLPWVAAPLIVAGVWEAWRRRGEPAVRMIVACLLIAPVAAALTTDGQPHATRSITCVIFWAVLAGMGIRRLLSVVPWRTAAASVIVLLAVANAALLVAHYFGDWKDRAFGAFDGGKGVVLTEAFARRGERPLYVPQPWLSDERLELLIPYWGHFPLRRWLQEGTSAFGIHPSTDRAPAGSLIIHGFYRDQPDGTATKWPRSVFPPAGAMPVFAVVHDGWKPYEIYEK